MELSDRAKTRLTWPDRHPALCSFALFVSLYVGLRVYSHMHDGPVLLAGAHSQQRLAIYAEFASSAIALLAVALTVLTILLALPDRPMVKAIQEGPYTWRLLKGLLMATAALALVTVVSAHLGTGLDNSKRGKEWLEQLLVASSVSTLVAFVVAGGTFWLILKRLDGPLDGRLGRGEGGPAVNQDEY
jgi:MFS-type transporter involved in bile tolerance (Atg22 family)